jgi:hypothetical protein
MQNRLSEPTNLPGGVVVIDVWGIAKERKIQGTHEA